MAGDGAAAGFKLHHRVVIPVLVVNGLRRAVRKGDDLLSHRTHGIVIILNRIDHNFGNDDLV